MTDDVPDLRKGVTFSTVKDVVILGSVIATVAVGWANMATKSDIGAVKERISELREAAIETKIEMGHLKQKVGAATDIRPQLDRIENNQAPRRQR